MNERSAFTDLFIKRPVLSIVVSLVIIIAGLQSYQSLVVRQFPKNDNAVVTINTVYVGADANLVRGFITTPIERAVASADGIDYVESTSKQGLSTIRARLKLNFDGSRALTSISTKVDQVRGNLPPGSEVPVITLETADSVYAAAYLSFNSSILKENEVTDYLVRVVQPRLSSVEGVQKADILGGQTYAMRIWMDPDKMAARNVSPAQVRHALMANNYLSAVGQTKGQLISVNLTANTDLRSVEDFEQLVVARRDDALTRLSDVADVVLGAETYDVDVRFSGDPSVFIGVWVLPSANSLDVITEIREEMDLIKQDLPAGMKACVAYDSTDYIRDAIDEVYLTLLQTLSIVVIVIFLFLGSARAVLVPVIAIPISLIGVFFVMLTFGFTVNLLTLLAIVLSVGIVVDDAIVIVENVARHLSNGRSPKDAAFIAARELIGPVIATTLVLVAVYLPIAFQGGLTGAYFKEFAITLTGAVLISTVVALTLSPAMSAKMLRGGDAPIGFAGWVNRQFEKLKDRYSRGLDLALNSRGCVYAIWAVITLLAIPMFMMSPKELAPIEDQGFLFAAHETPANSTLDQTVHYTNQVCDVWKTAPEYRFAFQLTQPTEAFGGMVVVPERDRERSVNEIIMSLQIAVSQIPGIRTFLVPPPALPGGGTFPVEFILSSTAPIEQILEFARDIQNRAMVSGMFAFPPLIDVKYDLPQSEIIIDRDKVAAMGLDLQSVGADLSAAMGGNYVNRFSMDGRSYKVIPQLERSSRLNPEQLNDIYTTGPDNKLIPLSSIATIKDSVQPRSLNRFQQLNAVKLSGICVRPLGEALGFLEAQAEEILPDGYSVDYTGESRQLRKEGGNSAFVKTFILAVIMIFLVLAAQFNSFRDPFIILLGSVPLALFSASIFTFLKMPDPNVPFFTGGWTTTLNIYSQVGLVTLVGLIAKNGILIVEFANALQKQGLSKLEAVREASLTRVRPILMTTAATIVGYFPLVIVSGAGAAARNSIGLILVGGLTIGTIFTLFVIPVIYTLIAAELNEAKL